MFDTAPRALALQAMIAHDQKYRVLLLEIQETLVDAFSHAENCKQQFVPFLEIVRANEALNINVNDPSTSDKSLDSFKEDMVKYNKQVKDIERLPTCALLGLIQLNTEQLKDGFAPAPKKCLQDIEELLPVLGQEKVKILLHEINSGNTALNKGEKAGTVPSTPPPSPASPQSHSTCSSPFHKRGARRTRVLASPYDATCADG